MMKYGLMLVLSAGFLVAADAPKETVKKETEKLKGTWQVQSLLKDGEVPSDAKALERFIITDDKVSVGTAKGSDTIDYFSFTIDPTLKPAAMYVKLFNGPEKGEVIKAIYLLEGDTLRICAALPGKDRPTKFSGDKGTGASLIVLKREKP
jgi:uncharacterized protein (TIGR03067 family)